MKSILKYIIENGSSRDDVIENNPDDRISSENLKTLQKWKIYRNDGQDVRLNTVHPRSSSEQYHIIKQQIKNLSDFMTRTKVLSDFLSRIKN